MKKKSLYKEKKTIVIKEPKKLSINPFSSLSLIIYIFYHLSSFARAHTHTHMVGCPRSVMVKAMDCGIVVREFVLQSRYYVHFRANTLGKGMNPLILLAMG